MKRIAIHDSTYDVPGSWNELTREQLQYLVKLSSREGLSTVELQLKFFLHCVGGSVRMNITTGLFTIKTCKSKHAMFVNELTAVLQAFEWLYRTNDDGEHELSPQLYINHHKKIRSGLRYLYGPGDALENITYDQFVWLQHWHSRLKSDLSALDELVNVIYKTKAGDQEVKNIHRLSPVVKTSILWFYLGTLQFLENQFPHVFTSGGDSSGSVFDSQQKIIDSLAEGDVTKKMKVRESLLYDALYSMEMAALRMKEYEKKNRK